MKRKLLCSLIAGLGLVAGGGAQAAISGGVVKIGVMTDMSGPYADLAGPGAVVAAKMAAEDYVKATGSKLKIEIVSADHQNKPDVGSSIARKWIDSEGVDMILDVATSSVMLAVAQVVKDKNSVMVNSTGGSSDMTGKFCNANTVHWTYDTWMLAHGTGSAVVKNGGDSWFFITADYAFGHSLEKDTSEAVKAAGGKVLGAVRAPLGTTDFSSFLLQAQGSKAKIIGLANAGSDATNTIKQAAEFGIVKGGQNLAGLLLFLSDVYSLGLQTAQGLQLTESFYWDMNDGTRAWSKRFGALHGGRMPTMAQAGDYAGMLHYLKAVDAIQEDKDGAKVVAEMKKLPTDDPLFGKGMIRIDGRKIHPAYLFEVKKPSESKGPWDLYKLLQTIPADKAFRPLNEGGCPLVKS
ncbi:MAG: ABC transporter substrate-binding protein [Burkholderiales bacterium]|uniref:ABC transporter substrate-binding protein n=2 Tax=Ottowia pentelensis TaxID=511108 RepID=A0ABV6PSF9_9BURK|nr:ABC transporter substrate-binding protein [Ottowia sp.]MBN9407133.1 ABC transporter substrate-binding protein [Burkholderiales bacterium]MBS0403912.1 ABC transporter substrate-binding protein [Pseudomonadota bacterium]